ncbi:unnamed protein product [Rotaria sordida]|uniref:Uncharacterized protein n=1 Tax=Rotaria sordida TaxID=392033 RepID=A0A818X0Z1_9BILA|nr:unnamed protein product [Rotaria sordida]
MRNDEVMRVYSNVKISRTISPLPPTPLPRRPSPLDTSQEPSSPNVSPKLSPRNPSPKPSSSVPPLRIANILIEPNLTLIDMVPSSFNPHEELDDDDDDDEDDIIYPEGVTELRPYKIVARYRRAIGETTDFRLKPILVSEDSTETLVLGLEHFAQQHNCSLTFTGENQQFDQSIYQAAAGVADLGSIHLLATDALLTANFQFEIDLDYDREIIQSEENIQKFVEGFCEAICKVLSCENGNVRVFSINKLADEVGKSQINFGLTTHEQKRTEQLAHDLTIYARSGFGTDIILQHVKPGEYECLWKPMVSYLQIRPSDLDPQFNFDYRTSGLPEKLTCGSYPYYLPLGWYRYALKVLDKYSNDNTWIGQVNAEGEWPVAFYGTHSDAVSSILQHGLLPSVVKTDTMKQEAITQIGEEANQPGFYVTTHCEGGSYPQYTTPFTVTTLPDMSEQFSLVFQCRVQPGKFTIHTSPVSVGKAWRIVDPSAIRPYGILVKKEVSTK